MILPKQIKMDIKNINYSNYNPYKNHSDYTKVSSIVEEKNQIKSITYQRPVGIYERLELALLGVFNLIKSCFSAETTSKHAWSLINTSLTAVEEKVVHLIIPPTPKSREEILIKALGWELVSGTDFLSKNKANFNLEGYVSHLLKVNFEGFTGIYQSDYYSTPDILIKSPEDLDNLIQLLGALGLMKQQEQLIEKCNQLKELKDYYHSILGFPVDLLESLSFTTLVLNCCEIFGDRYGNNQESMNNRACAIVDSYTLLKSYCYTEKDVPKKAWLHIYDFPLTLKKQKYKKFIEERTKRGYSLKKSSFYELGDHFDQYLSLTLKDCLNNRMCLKDSAPYYFHLLFPYGFHLVKLEGDERTKEERLQVLGTIGQKFLS